MKLDEPMSLWVGIALLVMIGWYAGVYLVWRLEKYVFSKSIASYVRKEKEKKQ